jgi:hypothetical protein
LKKTCLPVPKADRSTKIETEFSGELQTPLRGTKQNEAIAFITHHASRFTFYNKLKSVLC